MASIHDVIEDVRPWMGVYKPDGDQLEIGNVMMRFAEYEDRFAITLKNLQPELDLESIELCFGRDDVDKVWAFFSELRAKIRLKEKQHRKRSKV